MIATEKWVVDDKFLALQNNLSGGIVILLTKVGACAKHRTTMTKNSLIAAAALLVLPLAACDQKTDTVTAEAPDPQAAELAKAPKVELPPSIKATATFRCKDNSLVYIDFLSGDKAANLRTEKDGVPVKLMADVAGAPMVADGYSLSGSTKGITLTQPGKPSQPCKA